MTPASPERLRERRKMIQYRQMQIRYLEWQERKNEIFMEAIVNSHNRPGALVWQKHPAKPWWKFW